ncbi:MAG TPA: ABC transporter ATP-binding protein [Desulfosporosinus sp.]|nr:ABC transporter ATP-binding protein [Desulfosporosinus sp.]
MTELLVEVQNVGKTYTRGEAQEIALVSATCSVKPGDRIALVGPSGSGKSTLLHLMGGLDQPTSGNISWPRLGTRETLRPQKIGFIFQMQSLLPPLTVVENVELTLLLGHVEATKARKTALETLNMMRLNNIAEKLPEELSGGQAQRVAVARALACRPQLILADEPTGQLDHPTAQHLFDVLLDSLEGFDTALVVATHDQAVAERMKTIWQMHHGVMEVAVC